MSKRNPEKKRRPAPKTSGLLDPSKEPIRTFIALPLSEEVRGEIEQLQDTLKRRGLSLRWVPPANLHFTLKFLGNISPEIVEPMGARLSEATADIAPFEIAVGGLGAFPNLRSPRVFWAGLQAGSEPLIELARSVSEVVQEFPTQADRKPFKAHLTLGRAKDHRRCPPLSIPDALLAAPLGNMRCEAIRLIQSCLGTGGARYSVLREARLRGSRS